MGAFNKITEQVLERKKEQPFDAGSSFKEEKEKKGTGVISRGISAGKGAFQGGIYGAEQMFEGLKNVYNSVASDETFIQKGYKDEERMVESGEEGREFLNRIEQLGKGLTKTVGGLVTVPYYAAGAGIGAVAGAVAPEIQEVLESKTIQKAVETYEKTLPEGLRDFVSSQGEQIVDVFVPAIVKGVGKLRGKSYKTRGNESDITELFGEKEFFKTDLKEVNLGNAKKFIDDISESFVKDFVTNPMGKSGKMAFEQDVKQGARQRVFERKGVKVNSRPSNDKELARAYFTENFKSGKLMSTLEQSVEKLHDISENLKQTFKGINKKLTKTDLKSLKKQLITIADDAISNRTIQAESSINAYTETVQNMTNRLKVGDTIEDLWKKRIKWDYDMESARKSFDWKAEGASDRVKAGMQARNSLNSFIETMSGGIAGNEFKRLHSLYQIQDNTILRMWADASKRYGSLGARLFQTAKNIGIPSGAVGAGALAGGMPGVIGGALFYSGYHLMKSPWFKSYVANSLHRISNLITKTPKNENFISTVTNKVANNPLELSLLRSVLARNSKNPVEEIKEAIKNIKSNKIDSKIDDIIDKGAKKKLPFKKAETAIVSKNVSDSIKKAKAEGKSFDEWVKGQGEILYHGTNKNFDNFDIKKQKNIRNKEIGAGDGVYFSPNKEVAEKYAGASANANFDISSINEVSKKYPNSARFLKELVEKGDDAWKNKSLWKLSEKEGIDPNLLSDVSEYIYGSKTYKIESSGDEIMRLLGSGKQTLDIPDYIIEKAKKIGISEPKRQVKEVFISPNAKVFETKDRKLAQNIKGYDVIKITDKQGVDGVPEYLVKNTNVIKTRFQLKAEWDKIKGAKETKPFK